jgi:hypothetical protein
MSDTETLRFTNAEFCRFVQEAKDQRVRADQTEALLRLYREREKRISEYLGEGGKEGTCPICGWRPDTLHAPECPLIPVEPCGEDALDEYGEDPQPCVLYREHGGEHE